jgi:hypothetical protein
MARSASAMMVSIGPLPGSSAAPLSRVGCAAQNSDSQSL